MISLEFNGPVATATLSRAPINAISEDWLDRLGAIADEVRDRAGVSVLIIRSSERAFCGGADLKLMRTRFASREGRADMVAFVRRIQEVFAKVEALPAVTIAEVAGPALGGGLELALACDFRIFAHEAKVGLPEVRLGLLPGAGGTQRLTRICGFATAKRLILGGEVIGGEEAQRIGLAHWSVPRAALAWRTGELAAQLAELSGAALARSKYCIEAAIHDDPEGFAREIEGTAALFEDADTQQRVRDFLEGRSKGSAAA